MTKEEYHNNVMQRNASIMIGALLQDAAASIDVLLTEPNSDNKNPAFIELARALYDSAEIIQERVADTDDIDKAMDDIDVVINKALKYREDLQ